MFSFRFSVWILVALLPIIYWMATMLTTNVGDKICWWQFWDDGDWFITWTKSPTSRQQSPLLLFFNQYRKTFIIIKSPTYRCHQHHRSLISLIWCIFLFNQMWTSSTFLYLEDLVVGLFHSCHESCDKIWFCDKFS